MNEIDRSNGDPSGAREDRQLVANTSTDNDPELEEAIALSL